MSKTNPIFEQRNIWENLLWALGLTPGVVLGAIIVIAILGPLDDVVSKLQARGYWWILLIVGYVLSLIYLIYAPKFHANREREKTVSALMLYWEVWFAKKDKPQPSEDMIKRMRDELLERIKIWAWFDPELWSRRYREEKYSVDPFGIVDGLIAKWEEWRSKVASEDIGGIAGFHAEFAKYMLGEKKKEE